MLNPQSHPPPAPYHGMAVSEAAYWQYYYEGLKPTFEWNNGILEEKGVSDWETARLFFWFFQLLAAYLQTHPRADLVMLEMGFHLSLFGKTTIRRPDIGVVLRDNPVPLAARQNRYGGIFDICLEGLSDSNAEVKQNDTVVKRQEYAQVGVSEYYILHHDLKECRFYRLNRHQGVYVPLRPGRGKVICSQVLPGFQWRLEELIEQPPLLDLVKHPVYKDYVWPVLGDAWAEGAAAKRHAELEAQLRAKAEQAKREAEQRMANEAALRQAAEQRAKEEAQLRQTAEQRAAQYAEYLRQLGIDPATIGGRV